MLMKTKTVDFHHVEEHQRDMDKRLENWSLWLRVTDGLGRPHPMWANCKSNAWQWHPPEIRETCDMIDAQRMEKLVYSLPEKFREAIRWSYVYKFPPAKACRALAVTMDGLQLLVRNGRQMLINIS